MPVLDPTVKAQCLITVVIYGRPRTPADGPSYEAARQMVSAVPANDIEANSVAWSIREARGITMILAFGTALNDNHATAYEYAAATLQEHADAVLFPSPGKDAPSTQLASWNQNYGYMTTGSNSGFDFLTSNMAASIDMKAPQNAHRNFVNPAQLQTSSSFDLKHRTDEDQLSECPPQALISTTLGGHVSKTTKTPSTDNIRAPASHAGPDEAKSALQDVSNIIDVAESNTTTTPTMSAVEMANLESFLDELHPNVQNGSSVVSEPSKGSTDSTTAIAPRDGLHTNIQNGGSSMSNPSQPITNDINRMLLHERRKPKLTSQAPAVHRFLPDHSVLAEILREHQGEMGMVRLLPAVNAKAKAMKGTKDEYKYTFYAAFYASGAMENIVKDASSYIHFGVRKYPTTPKEKAGGYKRKVPGQDEQEKSIDTEPKYFARIFLFDIENPYFVDMQCPSLWNTNTFTMDQIDCDC
ncbi:hypothetical protein CF326_g752 [Tilletia indica]|nr:hypothetical protein CF326_g752 [Tilletia indica]